MSEEEYLRQERMAPHRSDYLAGEVYPVAPASPAHARLTANLLTLLTRQARQLPGGPATVLGPTTRLYAPAGPLFAYPDAALVLGPAQLRPDAHDDNLLNPVLLAHVLPHPTPAHFQQVFELYFSIPTVEHILLVTEYAARVSLGTRQPGGLLSIHGFTSLTDTIDLPDLGLQLPLAEIYRDVPRRV